VVGKNIAILPARGGSKRVSKKNISLFNDVPIISYSIEAAIKSELFDEIMVSTDDEEIADVALSYGAKVPFFRSDKTSSDHATTADVLLEVLGCYQNQGHSFASMCCIYPAAPFITKERIKQAYSLLSGHNTTSVLCASEYNPPIQRAFTLSDGKIKEAWPSYKNSRSQDLDPHYYDVGELYWLDVETFLKTKELVSDSTAAIVLSELEVQDINTKDDLVLANLKWKFREEVR
jgi:pseudaminic acid cytidylyltransferase